MPARFVTMTQVAEQPSRSEAQVYALVCSKDAARGEDWRPRSVAHLTGPPRGMGQRLYRDTERLIDEHPFTDTGDKRTSNQPPGADVMTLPAANRGPRRVQTLSDERIAELLEVACTAGAAAEAARQQMLTEADRRTAAIRQLHDAGLSVRWLAAALAVSPAVVAGILRRA